MRLRTYIIGSLWTGTILLIGAAITGILWWLLGALGDNTVAEGALGVALVALICLSINIVALVVLVALTTIKLVDRTSNVESSVGDRRSLQDFEHDDET